MGFTRHGERWVVVEERLVVGGGGGEVDARKLKKQEFNLDVCTKLNLVT